MKKIYREFGWADREEWHFPDDDADKLSWCLDQVADIVYFIAHTRAARRRCVQAGGAVGVFPLRLATFFDEVVSFEPMPENYECLMSNIMYEDAENLIVYNAALSDSDTNGVMQFEPGKADNYGAIYFDDSKEGEVFSLAIDSFQWDDVDLIQLDIEGGERRALQGAEETIKRCRPTIVIEEKVLPQCPTEYRAAREYIESLGYRQVGAINRDVVFRFYDDEGLMC